MTSSGTLTTLYNFCAQPRCADGGAPNDELVQASDGNFYGTTVGGGANGYGTVFAITSDGAYSVIYSFCSVGGTSCTDGAYPYAGLIQTSDGKLYGVTTQGGNANYAGTAFSLQINREHADRVGHRPGHASPAPTASSTAPALAVISISTTRRSR